MPKRWPISPGPFFLRPAQLPFTRWPRKGPSQASSKSRRSQLRFTPIAAGKIESWIIRCLIRTQGLLEKGEYESALVHCHEELDHPNLFARPGRADFFHRAISLFTRHGDYHAATSLCNRMAEEGFVISKKTYMVMLRGGQSHGAKQIGEILDNMLSGSIQLDDLAFKSILDLMVLHHYPPKDVEVLLEAYSSSRGSSWVPPISLFGTMIQSHSMADDLDKAQQWLDIYRDVWVKFPEPSPVGPPSKPSVASEETDTYASKLERKLRRRSGILLYKENPGFPYAAVLLGYTRSLRPIPKRIQWLFHRMREDGIKPDIDMYNMLIPALVRWGETRRAFRLFRALLDSDAATQPDAYTFRHLFIALNPRRPRGRWERPPPSDLSSRELFHSMIAVKRRQLNPRKPQPHKNIISTASLNCALGTYCAQGDYAAAWTVLALFTRHHVTPDTHTSRIVILGLLRRMQTELADRRITKDVVWMDRFIGQRRATMLEMTHRPMLADILYALGRSAGERIREEGESHLRPSFAISRSARQELEFLVGLMRLALQAALGYQRNTADVARAEKAIDIAMYEARNAMMPRGRWRSEASSKHV